MWTPSTRMPSSTAHLISHRAADRLHGERVRRCPDAVETRPDVDRASTGIAPADRVEHVAGDDRAQQSIVDVVTISVALPHVDRDLVDRERQPGGRIAGDGRPQGSRLAGEAHVNELAHTPVARYPSKPRGSVGRELEGRGEIPDRVRSPLDQLKPVPGSRFEDLGGFMLDRVACTRWREAHPQLAALLRTMLAAAHRKPRIWSGYQGRIEDRRVGVQRRELIAEQIEADNLTGAIAERCSQGDAAVQKDMDSVAHTLRADPEDVGGAR